MIGGVTLHMSPHLSGVPHLHVNRSWGFVPHQIALARARKPYRVGLLFTRKNRDFGAISVTERICGASISKAEIHISDTFLPLFVTVFSGVWTVIVGERTGTH